MERRYSQLNQSRAPGARGYSKTINQAERQARAAAVNHQPSRASGARGYSNHQQIDINIRGGRVANQLVTASHRHTHPSDGSALGRQAVPPRPTGDIEEAPHCLSRLCTHVYLAREPICSPCGAAYGDLISQWSCYLSLILRQYFSALPPTTEKLGL